MDMGILFDMDAHPKPSNTKMEGYKELQKPTQTAFVSINTNIYKKFVAWHLEVEQLQCLDPIASPQKPQQHTADLFI